jgi:hypothetical protein
MLSKGFQNESPRLPLPCTLLASRVVFQKFVHICPACRTPHRAHSHDTMRNARFVVAARNSRNHIQYTSSESF